MFRYKIGRERQLFVDDMLVAETQHLRKTLHQPVKYEANPVLGADHPLEQGFLCLHGTVLFDEAAGLFKAWYLTETGIGYAFSADGLAWHKPVPDLFQGVNAAPNTVYRGVHPDRFGRSDWKVDGCAVVMAPAHDPGCRYRMLTFEVAMDPEQRAKDPYGSYGYFAAFSPDGVHWSAEAEPVISRREDPEMSDAHTCGYDRLRGRFIAFTKKHKVCPHGLGDQDTMLRVRGVAFSTDFRRWTRPVACLIPDDHDPRDVHFYRMNGWAYEGMYLGELEIYYSDPGRRDKPMMRDVQLVSSRDGELWWRAGGRQTYIACGPEGAWDSKLLDVNSAGPIRVGDALRIYYGGRCYPHNRHPRFFPGDWPRRAAIGMATLRRDGFVSYDADEQGTLVTKPIQFEGARELHLNVDASDGWARVEVLRSFEHIDVPEQERVWRFAGRESCPGFTLDDAEPITGDCLDASATWRQGSDLSRLERQWIVLRFELHRARLYSFWFD